MKRRFVQRSAARKPTRAWSDVSTAWVFTAETATASVRLMSFESPTSMVGLTADPPEDITILRVVGSFGASMAASATGRWTMALIVQDHTWTPAATQNLDNDKRVLWQREFWATSNPGWTGSIWTPPDSHIELGTVTLMARTDACRIDISPKVRLEAGKALYLVAYENSGTGAFTSSSQTMRVLYQRSGRR